MPHQEGIHCPLDAVVDFYITIVYSNYELWYRIQLSVEQAAYSFAVSSVITYSSVDHGYFALGAGFCGFESHPSGRPLPRGGMADAPYSPLSLFLCMWLYCSRTVHLFGNFLNFLDIL